MESRSRIFSYKKQARAFFLIERSRNLISLQNILWEFILD